MTSFPLWLLAKWLGTGLACAGFVWWAKRAGALLPTACLAALLAATTVIYDLRLLTVHREGEAATRRAAEQCVANAAKALFTPEPPPPAAVTVATPTTAPTTSLHTEAALDRLKQEQENVWVYYFLMTRCKHASEQDAAALRRSMDAELARRNAPAGMADSILMAARGTVETLYERQSCAKLPEASVRSFRAYVEKLSDTP